MGQQCYDALTSCSLCVPRATGLCTFSTQNGAAGPMQTAAPEPDMEIGAMDGPDAPELVEHTQAT